MIQEQPATGYYSGSTLKGKWTYYTYTIGTNYMDISYVELFRYEPTEWTDLKGYWLASRCVDLDSANANFRMFYVSGGTVGAYYLYDSRNGSNSVSYAVRPVVEIDLTSASVGESGSGTREDPYSIRSKNRIRKMRETASGRLTIRLKGAVNI